MIRWRVAVPAALSLAALAGCLIYLLLASAPGSQPVTLIPTTETVPPPTVGQALATDTLNVANRRLRPSDEDIAKAFRRATEDPRSVEVQEATRNSDEPAITGPIPLPKKRPPAASGEVHNRLFQEFVQWRKASPNRQ